MTVTTKAAYERLGMPGMTKDHYECQGMTIDDWDD